MTKVRDSGMPPEPMWDSFFSAEEVLSRLGVDKTCGNIAEFGCGYGTFTIPAARIIQGTVYSFDIELQMIELTANKAKQEGLSNICARLRDFEEEGCGLDDESVSYAMLFNILHCENPLELLREAWRVLEPGGKLGVIHWRTDIQTPRGPSPDIRPRPSDCAKWAHAAGFVSTHDGAIDLPPYHYGLVFQRPSQGKSGA